MKKIIVVIVSLLAIVISLSACQDPEIKEGDVTINNPAPIEPGPTGVNIFLQTQIARGEYGFIDINRVINNTEYDIIDAGTVMDQVEYSYEIESGDYHLTIWGPNFNADVSFTVNEGEMTDLVVVLSEWFIPTFNLDTSSGSPSEPVAPGVNVELFRFNVSHNWGEPLTPTAFGFYIGASSGVSVDNCKLYISTLSGWSTIGGPIATSPGINGFDVYFSDWNGLDTTLPVHPLSANTYSLRCEVYGNPGDTLRAYFSSFGVDMSAYGGINYLVNSWGSGNMLSF